MILSYNLVILKIRVARTCESLWTSDVPFYGMEYGQNNPLVTFRLLCVNKLIAFVCCIDFFCLFFMLDVIL